MKREELIEEVKEEYANIKFSKDQSHFHQTTSAITAEDYYENLQSAVISEIDRGKFDNFRTGREIVNSVAADKSLLSNWQ